MTRRAAVAAFIAVFAAVALSAVGQEPPKKDAPKYKAGDQTRPRPRVMDPGTAEAPAKAPSDAVSLFDGKSLGEWVAVKKADDPAPKWKVEPTYFEVVPTTGHIVTKQKFGNAQIHLEWATPPEPKGNGQGRGNSGIKMGGFGEVQILDSFGNDTYPDGQAAALYGKFPPLVNASRKPGEWQSFDIITQLTKVNEAGMVVRPARITVLHNGILVHHAVEVPGKVEEYTILLQDHRNAVRFRNVWVRKLTDYDEGGTPPPAKKE